VEDQCQWVKKMRPVVTKYKVISSWERVQVSASVLAENGGPQGTSPDIVQGIAATSGPVAAALLKVSWLRRGNGAQGSFVALCRFRDRTVGLNTK